ncbi:trypsin-2-like [Nasonia vitripennis]|uniref:Peptidase S1 domain-containing protein n=1 Tax=Nasonia vitripennis TaxID=7425 RepID=A0A7M7QPB8_NASVI|nr:trypsin-2-like [Nasonia vitripennis]
MYRLLLLVALVGCSHGNYRVTYAYMHYSEGQMYYKPVCLKPCTVARRSRSSWLRTSCDDAFIENFKVVAGSKYTDARGESEHEVVETVHHAFGSGGKVDPSRELVLLRVSPPISFDAKRQPVKLVDADYLLVPGQKLSFSGYGYTDGFVKSPTLRSGSGNSILLEDCVKAYEGRFGSLYPGLACSDGNATGTSACIGDSGTPVLLEDGRLVAVSTTRYSCGKPSKEPDVLALVAKVRSWIKIVTNV